MGLLDKSGAHAAVLRNWLGGYLADPHWEGSVVKYQIRTDDNQVLTPASFQPLTQADCQGAFRSEFQIIQQKLNAGSARTGTEKALRLVMLDRFQKLISNSQAAANSGAFAKYRDASGVWRLVWLWGFERKTPEPGQPAICPKPDCQTLAVVTEDRQSCPRCKAKLKTSKSSALPKLAMALALLFLLGGVGFGVAKWLGSKSAAEPAGDLVVLEGRVFSAAGQKPVPGATVTWRESQATTDAEGKFELEDLPAESVTLNISAPGFHEAKVKTDLSKEDQRFLKTLLKGQAEISGVVTGGPNRDPVPKATVSFSAWNINGQTDEQGKFHLKDVPAGTWQLQVSANGFQALDAKHDLPVGSTPLEIQLTGSRKVAGTVLDVLTGLPVSNANVIVLTTPLSAKTDAQGRFEITGISQAEATIGVHAAGYLPASDVRTFDAGGSLHFPVRLHGSGWLRARILSKADGKPVQNAEVKFNIGKYPYEEKTDSQGMVRFPKVPPGMHTVSVSALGFDEMQSELPSEEAGDTGDILLTGNASLSGQVTDALENTPLENVEVRIVGTDLVTKTDKGGMYNLSGIPAREGSVQVVAMGYRQEFKAHTFEPKTTSKLPFALKGGTILSGVVTDETTKTPIAQAEVTLKGTTQKTKTDEKGAFRFEDIVAGSKTLTISATGYQPSEKSTELMTEKESTLEIPLKGDAEISGSVVAESNDKPLAGVKVQIAGTSRETLTDAQGKFRLEDVPSGATSHLQFAHAGYRPANIATEVIPGEGKPVSVALMGAAGFTGSITDANGQPIPGAVINVPGTSAEAVSEENGDFHIAGLMPGETQATFVAKGFHPEQRTATLGEDQPAALGAIVLKPIAPETNETLAQPFNTPAPEGVILTDGGETVAPSVLIPRLDFLGRLQRMGAKTGDVQVSLAWDNPNDIDLHVQAPSGEVIHFANRRSRCGGELDVDMNAGGTRSNEPIENTYWPLNTAPRGKYKVLAHYYGKHGGADPTKFRVAVKNGGDVKYYNGQLKRQNEKVLVCEFERQTGPEPVPYGMETVPRVVDDPRTFVVGNPHVTEPDERENPRTPGNRVPVYNRNDEDLAANQLRLAKRFRDPNDTKKWMTDIAKRYPNTKAGREALGFLDELASGNDLGTDLSDGIYLADLTHVRQNAGRQLLNHKATVNKKNYSKALWTSTSFGSLNVQVDYVLGGKYSKLSGAVGIEDRGQADRRRVPTTFKIIGDGKLLWTSKPLLTPGKTDPFNVDVSRIKSLRILTDSNNLPSHYAVWTDPFLAGHGSSD